MYCQKFYRCSPVTHVNVSSEFLPLLVIPSLTWGEANIQKMQLNSCYGSETVAHREGITFAPFCDKQVISQYQLSWVILDKGY